MWAGPSVALWAGCWVENSAALLVDLKAARMAVWTAGHWVEYWVARLAVHSAAPKVDLWVAWWAVPRELRPVVHWAVHLAAH